MNVVLYEKEDYLGGNTKTGNVDGIDLDLGFMVFNREIDSQLLVTLLHSEMMSLVQNSSAPQQRGNWMPPFFLHQLIIPLWFILIWSNLNLLHLLTYYML